MLFLISLLSSFMASQPASPVSWSFSSTAQPNGTINIELTANVESGWHIYSTSLAGNEGPIPTTFSFKPSNQYMAIGNLQEPKAVEQYDPNFAMMVRHHSGKPTFILNVKPAVAGTFVVEGELEYMVCNSSTCLPPLAVPFKITVNQGGAK
ncbi:MAG TPA: protein-disulfide reductase DsbD family protein [Flavobacteriales bacterium]|nr:protein-disulfide reductase DsbD family protein [Flavobacteriales bacterium]